MDRLNGLNLGLLYLFAVIAGGACFAVGALVGTLLNRGRRT